MNNEKCNKVMDKFLELDKDSRIPLSVSLHLIFCKKCRTQVRLCTLAEKASAKPLNTPLPLNNEMMIKIMKQIDPTFVVQETNPIKPVSMKGWIIAGIIMICTMLTFGFQTSPETSKTLVSFFYLVFAMVISIYCAFFVGSNLDFFVKKFETVKHTNH